VDSYGLPVCFSLSGGQVRDIVHAEELINQSPKSSYIVANKGYDSENTFNSETVNTHHAFFNSFLYSTPPIETSEDRQYIAATST